MPFSFRTTLKFFCYLLLFLPVYSAAQVLERFPPGQQYYRGGWRSLDKEMKELAKTLDLKPCENDGERYIMSVLVNPDGKPNFVKDFDTVTIQQNKCAYDMSRKLLPHLKGWAAASVDGKPVKAITTINVIPYNLFNERPKITERKVVEPKYHKGNSSFHYQVKHILESSLSKNVDQRRVVLAVKISPEGVLENVEVRNIEVSELSRRKLIADIKAIKGKWTPATVNGIPVNFTLVLTFQQNFNFELEKDKFDNNDNTYRGTF